MNNKDFESPVSLRRIAGYILMNKGEMLTSKEIAEGLFKLFVDDTFEKIQRMTKGRDD
jgi:hypothetical protein